MGLLDDLRRWHQPAAPPAPLTLEVLQAEMDKILATPRYVMVVSESDYPTLKEWEPRLREYNITKVMMSRVCDPGEAFVIRDPDQHDWLIGRVGLQETVPETGTGPRFTMPTP